MQPTYEIDSVTKVYKRGKVIANQDISFSILQGEILGILGPNGAGKTTLVRQMVAHLKPTKGTIRLWGRDVGTSGDYVARNVAYYAQAPYALNSLTVWEAIYLTGRLRGMPACDARNQTQGLLDELDLGDVSQKPLGRVSGGQQRLVGIGATLIGDLPVLVLDEPTNELDPRKRRLVWDLLRERNRKGVTIVLVTHNVHEAEQVVDRVAMINDSRLQVIDTVGSLKQQVDSRIKVEMAVPFDNGLNNGTTLASYLEGLGTLEPVGENRLRMLVDAHGIEDVFERVVAARDMGLCEDFWISPPSLEDVYLFFDQDKEGGTSNE